MYILTEAGVLVLTVYMTGLLLVTLTPAMDITLDETSPDRLL